MFPDRNNLRMQQQPTPEHGDRQQQQAGSTEFQKKPEGQEQQMGEGSYEGTREFQNRIKNYMENADVEADAENARPRSEEEARELEKAEREGQSHSKGER